MSRLQHLMGPPAKIKSNMADHLVRQHPRKVGPVKSLGTLTIIDKTFTFYSDILVNHT